ncbi:DUF1345 domain-containing protein [Hymenobacter convexus]|uniref:DUF1345 domain-containing protein n=1 Tax=Hymenobacter sp. CA1UV-4 TaxID=3063782 RepID=UPI002713A24B|nr:DUF1345 domain-containing protein [Hymenobacter sp. CA1UV-4]MDO7851185.1 DUF1345 domain-containing protein [Hymenobacter sp. CA1UV-4]
MDAALSTRLSALTPLRPGLLPRLIHLLLALAIGGLGYRLAPPDFSPLTRLMMGWDGFVLSILLLSWMTIFHTRVADMPHVVKSLQPNKTWLLLLLATFTSTTISIVAVVLMLHNMQAMALEERVENISVSVVAIGSTWCLMHTLFALHYAHTYFTLRKDTAPDAGLLFTGAEPTSYWDFAYFSFVIGMTSQTADVAITSLRMRQLVLFHSLMAFAFNTTIVALTINILAGLL